IDSGKRAVEVLQVGDHDFIPEALSFEVAHEMLVDYGELAREVGFDVQILVGGLDAGRYADDIGNRCSWGNGYAIGVAHALSPDAFTQRIPIHDAALVDVEPATALLAQQSDGVVRQDALIP